MTMKKSKIRRKAKRQAQREEVARREKFLREIDAPKRRLEAEIAARGKLQLASNCGLKIYTPNVKVSAPARKEGE